jgi:hypothetical protein
MEHKHEIPEQTPDQKAGLVYDPYAWCRSAMKMRRWTPADGVKMNCHHVLHLDRGDVHATSGGSNGGY